MTTTSPAAASSPAAPSALATGAPRTAAASAAARWRRWRWPLAIALVVVLVALVTALTVSRGTGEDLDPADPGRTGARAVARILGDQGVRVQRVTRSRDAARAATAGTTLVVVRPGLLTPEQLRRLRTDADLVLIRPDAVALDALAPEVEPAGTEAAQTEDPDCSLPIARAAGDARAGGALYRAAPGASVSVCYPGTESGTGSYVRTRSGGRTVTVVGQPDILTNEHLAADGNAALALRTLGARGELVWYLPDPLEAGAAGDAPELSDLVPRWVRWVALQLALAALVAVAWRARRLGPLVPEPLPVVVRSAETQEGRARLYRQSRARGRAAATLRTAALRRLATRLAVPAGTTPQDVVVLVATLTGRPDAQVHDVLLGPAPRSDEDLVRLAGALDALERETITEEREPRS